MLRRQTTPKLQKNKVEEGEEVVDGLVAYNRYRNSKNIVLFAFLSRALFVTLIFIFDAVVSDYDSSSLPSNDLNAALKERTPRYDGFCTRMQSISVWDSVHVLRIAEVGDYEYEHSRAFYPALPFLLRFLHRNSDISMCVLTSTALVLNAVVSIVTVVVMEKLAFVLLLNAKKGEILGVQFADKCASLARTTALLYCFTPASIFHFAPGYTEAMFTFFATYGALLFARGSMHSHKLDWRYWLNKGTSYVFFATAASFRSNGVLLGIFPACEIAVLLFAVKHERKYWSQRLTALPLHVVGGLCIALPTVLVQNDAYKKFCGPDSRYEKARPWCAKFPPDVYSFVQSEYWNVGFLKSWRFSQIGNILIGSPALLFSMYCLFKKYRVVKASETPVAALAGDLLWLMSCVLCATVTHIQISMRFMSVLAAPYVEIARLGDEWGQRAKYSLASFFVAYALVGFVLFCNFYPWT